MKWASWRASDAKNASPDDDSRDPTGRDPAAELRARTRRRLIGAAALLLAAVILVPMVLDSTPRSVPDNVAIDIPGDKVPFAPRLPAPADTPRMDRSSAKAVEAPAPKPAASAAAESGKPADAAPPAAKPKEAAPAKPAAAADPGHFALQAAAFRNEAAARALVAKLKKAGFTPYTERIATKNGEQVRVRVGPFATRDDADKARVKLKALGINADVVSG